MARQRPAAAPHPFTPDPDIGPAYDGRLTCNTCRMLGRRDDARHTMPEVPEQAEHLRRYGEESGPHPFDPDPERPRTCRRIDCRSDISDRVHIRPAQRNSTQAVDREGIAVD